MKAAADIVARQERRELFLRAQIGPEGLATGRCRLTAADESVHKRHREMDCLSVLTMTRTEFSSLVQLGRE